MRSRWHPLSDQVEDIPGAKLYVADQVSDAPHEVLVCWWTASTFTEANAPNLRYLFPTKFPAGQAPATVPAGGYHGHTGHPLGPPPSPTMMLFSDAQYRSWSLFARFLAEAFLVPRNVVLLPWERRGDNMASPTAAGASPPLRRIILADPNFSPIVRDLAALGFTEPMFDLANLAQFQAAYDKARVRANTLHEPLFDIHGNNKALNQAWLEFFKSYRGIVGHGFAGSATKGDHDCPGPVFDWFRFARELWDWWWYPFDFDAGFATARQAMREYFEASGDVPLIEYFFENTPSIPVPDPYIARTFPPAGPPGGILGPPSSPNTFGLETGTPIYAMANGELVAARLRTDPGVSMSFMLIRHEVFHVPDLTGMEALLLELVGDDGSIPAGWARPGRIDYNVPPTTVYSLYMHLDGIENVNFDEPLEFNPGWLNRLLIRYKECRLAIDDAGNLNPAFHGMPDDDFAAPPPAAAARPRAIDLLRLDRERIGGFLDQLRAGNVAIPPTRAPWDRFGPTPVKVLLGDFLGDAGTIRVDHGTRMQGILVEVFSPQRAALYFTEVTGKTGWDVPSASPTRRSRISANGRARSTRASKPRRRRSASIRHSRNGGRPWPQRSSGTSPSPPRTSSR